MNDNSLKKLLTVVEPKIRNIEEHRIECSSLKSVHETMQELVELGNSSYKEILDFYDQEFIFKAIKIGNSNSDILLDKYKSSKYLLKNNSDNLHELPQYKESISFMEQLYMYLCGLNEKIQLDYEQKIENLKVEELLNKYYNLLNKDNIFIKDIDEFLTFVDLNKLEINERLNVLITINKLNIKNYVTTNDIDIGNNINLSNIFDLLNQNKDLIDNNLTTVDLDNVNESLLSNDDWKNDLINLEENLKLRKNKLINIINIFYKNKNYSKIVTLYDEFKELEKLEIEINKQKNSSKELIFMFKNDKSLVREYLDKTNNKYKSCILKNLLDLETNNALYLPKTCYNNQYLYIKDDFVVKTVYTYIDNYILVLGVLDKNETLEEFIKKNEYLLNEVINNKSIKFDKGERNLILKDIKLEDLVLSIDLDTLDVKVEEENGR